MKHRDARQISINMVRIFEMKKLYSVKLMLGVGFVIRLL